MNQEHTQIDITSFGDAEQPRLSACRHLLRHEAEPGRDVTSLAKCFTISNSSNERSRTKDADARDRGQTVRSFISPSMLAQIIIQSISGGAKFGHGSGGMVPLRAA